MEPAGVKHVRDSDNCRAHSTESRTAAYTTMWGHWPILPPAILKTEHCVAEAGCAYAREGWDACSQGCIDAHSVHARKRKLWSSRRSGGTYAFGPEGVTAGELLAGFLRTHQDLADQGLGIFSLGNAELEPDHEVRHGDQFLVRPRAVH
jgi:hypothetical protein